MLREMLTALDGGTNFNSYLGRVCMIVFGIVLAIGGCILMVYGADEKDDFLKKAGLKIFFLGCILFSLKYFFLPKSGGDNLAAVKDFLGM